MPTSKPSSSSVAVGNITGLGDNVSTLLVNGVGDNVPTFLKIPSSANLASAMTDKTGTGVLTFATSPTITGNLAITGGIGIHGVPAPSQAAHISNISSERQAVTPINALIAIFEANGMKALN